VVIGNGEVLMSSTIETLERELGEAQAEREAEQRAVIRAENAHEAACSARDEAWSEGSATDPEVEELTALVYRRRRELYDAIDRLKAAEGKERRIKSRLMYVLPAERRRYLSGAVDEEFEALLVAVREAYQEALPGVLVYVVTERPEFLWPAEGAGPYFLTANEGARGMAARVVGDLARHPPRLSGVGLAPDLDPPAHGARVQPL
jgi:hypothetical protein